MNRYYLLFLSIILASCVNQNKVCIYQGPCFDSFEEAGVWVGEQRDKKVAVSLKKIAEENLRALDLSAVLVERVLLNAKRGDQHLLENYGRSSVSHFHVMAYDRELDLEPFKRRFPEYVRSHSVKECADDKSDGKRYISIEGFEVTGTSVYELEYSYSCPPVIGNMACGGRNKASITNVNGNLSVKDIQTLIIYN